MEKLNQKYQPAVKRIYCAVLKNSFKDNCHSKCCKFIKFSDRRPRRVTNRFCTHRSTFGNSNINKDNNIGHLTAIDIIF